jgi:hypothetical protein
LAHVPAIERTLAPVEKKRGIGLRAGIVWLQFGRSSAPREARASLPGRRHQLGPSGFGRPNIRLLFAIQR